MHTTHENCEAIGDSPRQVIVQTATDLFLKRKLTLDEMCNLLQDVGADSLAERFRTTLSDTYRVGPDGFILK